MQAQLRAFRAFTLVEVLVVFAVIALLAGLSLAVFGGAKRRSYATVNVSNLRQLGQAGAMYAEEAGRFPDSVVPLVRSGVVPAALVASPDDPTKEGYANVSVKAWERGHLFDPSRIAPFKSSYPGLREQLITDIMWEKYIRGQSGGGWLVDVTDSVIPAGDDVQPLDLWEGTYRRLLYDGAVVVRTFRSGAGKLPDGKKSPFRSPEMLFTDDPAIFSQSD
ncbi:hypothetical protein BH11ARM2_BH11ARM2_17500 [soil metagenome]